MAIQNITQTFHYYIALFLGCMEVLFSSVGGRVGLISGCHQRIVKEYFGDKGAVVSRKTGADVETI